MKSKELKASSKSISVISSELGDEHMITHEAMMDHLFGAPATPSRNAYEQGFEAFKLGAMIKDLRESQQLTQEQLATKCSTTKSYISRIENNASDIRLSTLMRIINEGLGAKLTLQVSKP